MGHRGRVLVIEENSCAETRPLWDEVRQDGYAVTLTPLSASAGAIGRDGRPDVILLNLVAAERMGDRAHYLDAAARLFVTQGGLRVPVIAVGDTGEGLRPFGIYDVVANPLSPRRLTSRIASATRLATMHAEARRRMATAAAFGVNTPDVELPSPDAEADILVIGAGIKYLAVERLLARFAMIVGAFTTQTALDYLERRRFDAVIVNAKAEAAGEFLRDLRQVPQFFATPAIVLLADREADRVDELFDAGATEAVLESAIDADLPRAVRALVAEHRLRETLRATYSRGRELVTTDGLTGLYSAGFLLAHLERCLADAANSGEPLCVASFVISNLSDLNAVSGHAGGDHLIRQIGLTIGRLTRGEDLAARIGAGRFAVVLPGTVTEDAEAAMWRIGAIVRSTRFSVPGSGQSVEVDPDIAVVAPRPGETAEGLLRRAFGRPG